MKFVRIRKSAVASQPCPSCHITADKRFRSNCLRQLLLSVNVRQNINFLAKEIG